MKRQAISEKVFVVGIDAMDPRLTMKYIEEGIMPNFKKFMERGSVGENLDMIGGQPTVTPPMWTTLGTGASPRVHGITDYRAQGDGLDKAVYNFDSRRCKAEPMWNVSAEAGIPTLVWHWPGSSWPPTSDSPFLTVVDGSQPGGPNVGIGQVDGETLVIAGEKTPTLTFKQKAASDSKVPCMESGMDVEENKMDTSRYGGKTTEQVLSAPENNFICINKQDLFNELSTTPLDVVFSPIADANGWSMELPEGTKEFFLLYSKGMIRRALLLFKNEQGEYDTVKLYKNKKSVEPIAVLPLNEFVGDIVDEAIHNDETIPVSRNMRVLEIAPDGSSVRLWFSPAMDFNNDTLWHPKSILKEINENVGYPVSVSMSGASDARLIRDCTEANWAHAAKWNAESIKYLVKTHGYKIIYSHFHNIDLQGHLLVQYLKTGHGSVSPEEMQELFKQVYVQTDEYLGYYMDMLDDGWTLMIVSDHGQTCPEYGRADIVNTSGAVNAYVLGQLGYTVMKKDADGNDTREIDWSKTTAVAARIHHIYINLKGRDATGIVEPEDKYELEERIITDLYSLRDPQTGHRIIHMALRNRDAALLGEGGPESGDILYWVAEGYTWDHADSVSTIDGACDTSVRSIFMAAGKGIKENYVAKDRMIAHKDVTPTVAALAGLRFPAQCEGAPIYQIIDEDF